MRNEGSPLRTFTYAGLSYCYPLISIMVHTFLLTRQPIRYKKVELPFWVTQTFKNKQTGLRLAAKLIEQAAQSDTITQWCCGTVIF